MQNLTVDGIDLSAVEIGTRLRAGTTLLEVTQIGKECHARCAIYPQAGDCVMPKDAIFAKVLQGGVLRPGDRLSVCPDENYVESFVKQRATG